MLKRILLLLLIVFVVIQFFRPTQNKAEGRQTSYLGEVYAVPTDVQAILNKACMDCHSNNTNYPWYSNVQPVAWWLDGHIVDGKKHLNFDSFLVYTPKRQDHKMEEVIEMVEDNHMPLNSYTWIHTDAKLTEEEKKKLISWAESVRQEITEKTGFRPEPKKEQ